MNDDLGRGMLGWTPERWQALDIVASDTLTGNAILRNLLEHREEAGAFSARIAGKNVDVVVLSEPFTIDMEYDDDEDVQRKVQSAAQKLAAKEDEAILERMNFVTVERSKEKILKHDDFGRAKNELRSGGQNGLGV